MTWKKCPNQPELTPASFGVADFIAQSSVDRAVHNNPLNYTRKHFLKFAFHNTFYINETNL